MKTVRRRQPERINERRAAQARVMVAALVLGLSIAIFPTATRATEPTTSTAASNTTATRAPAELPPSMPPAREPVPVTSPAPAAAAARPPYPDVTTSYYPHRRRPAPSIEKAPSSSPPTMPVDISGSYGWQIVIADVGGFAGTLLLHYGLGAEGLAASAPYYLASPIVHLTHGNPGRALGAFGIRLTGQVMGIFVGFAAASRSGSSLDDAGPYVAFGVLTGMAVATVIDASFLAHSTVEFKPQPALVPTVSLPRSGGATVGLAASF